MDITPTIYSPPYIYMYVYMYMFVSDKPVLLSDRPLALLVTRHAAAHRDT